MLASMPGWKFREWQIYEELELFPAERADWNAAHIVQWLARNGKPLKEFKLPFGDEVPAATPQQTLEYQESLIIAWCAGANLIAENKAKRGS